MHGPMYIKLIEGGLIWNKTGCYNKDNLAVYDSHIRHYCGVELWIKLLDCLYKISDQKVMLAALTLNLF